MDSTIELINKLKDIPAMPNVIMKILTVMKNDTSNLGELAELMSYDQSLCAKVLALVNSAYYGFTQQINSISRALPLLGLQKVKNIVVAVAMKPMLINQGDKNLWEHSVRVAIACETYAKFSKIMDENEAFVVGFLHDIGKIALNLSDFKKYKGVISAVEFGANILESEKLYFKCDHTQTGALLAKRWQLPILITNVIKYHHNPEASSVVEVCKLVNAMDKIMQPTFDIKNVDDDFLKNINMSISELTVLFDTINKKASLMLNELS